MVSSLAERLNGNRFLVRCFPDISVYPRCSFSSIFCHSPHGQNPTAERVGQQTLQSLHLAPSAFLRRLHDTHLQSAHSLVGFSPVDRVPVHCFVGGCTNIICFPFLADSATSLVMKDRVEVCPLSRGMLSGRQGLPSIPIPPITGRPSLFPHSFARQPTSLPYGSPASYEAG